MVFLVVQETDINRPVVDSQQLRVCQSQYVLYSTNILEQSRVTVFTILIQNPVFVLYLHTFCIVNYRIKNYILHRKIKFGQFAQDVFQTMFPF